MSNYDDAIESDDRELCFIDTCIGLLHADGSCKECGATASTAERKPPAFNPMRRRLCPDGACIGIMQSDGRCGECGTIGASAVQDPRLRGLRSLPPAPDEQTPIASTEQQDPSSKEPLVESTSPSLKTEPSLNSAFDPSTRTLCPDGSCIGLVDASGRCSICDS